MSFIIKPFENNLKNIDALKLLRQAILSPILYSFPRIDSVRSEHRNANTWFYSFLSTYLNFFKGLLQFNETNEKPCRQMRFTES